MYSALSVVTPPAKEPVTTEEAKRFLRVSHDDDDDLIAALEVTARDMVEKYCRRALITTRYRFSIQRDAQYGYLPVLPYIQVMPYLPTFDIELPRSDVTAIHSVTQTTDDGTVTVLGADDYRAIMGTNPTRISLLSRTVPQHFARISIEFSAGYGTEPSSVPRTIRTAIMTLMAWLYENRGDADTGEMPKTVIRLLTGDRVYSA